MKRFSFFLFFLCCLVQASTAQIGKAIINSKFGTDGTTYLKEPDFDFTNTQVFLYPTTKEILTTGIFIDYNNEVGGLFFAKYKANGKRDSSFATDGILMLDETETPFTNILRIRQGSDNSFLILLGNNNVYNADSTGILCFTSSGKIVTDFGTGGILSTATADQIRDFDLLQNGKLLTLNSSVDSITFEAKNTMTRYTQIGLVDKSFSASGTIEINKGFEQFVLMERNNQDYICAGNVFDPKSFTVTPMFAKVSANAVMDKSFGTKGIALGAIPPASELANPLQIQLLKDGAFLWSGYFENEDTGEFSNFISKIDKMGKAITTFGKKGYVIMPEVLDVSLYYNLSVHELSASNQLLITRTVPDDAETLEISMQLLDVTNGKVKTTFGTDGDFRIKLNDIETTVFASTLINESSFLVAGDVTNTDLKTFEASLSKFDLVLISATDENPWVSKTQLSPNPVKDAATLTYELPEAATVTLALYDLAGKQITQLQAAQQYSAGKQTTPLNFDASLPAGQYFLKIDLGTKGFKTLKMNKL
jgi:hypothetical protein